MPTPHVLVHDRHDNGEVWIIGGLTAGTQTLCVVTAGLSGILRQMSAGGARAEMIRPTVGRRFTASEAFGYRQFVKMTFHRPARA